MSSDVLLHSVSSLGVVIIVVVSVVYILQEYMDDFCTWGQKNVNQKTGVVLGVILNVSE